MRFSLAAAARAATCAGMFAALVSFAGCTPRATGAPGAATELTSATLPARADTRVGPAPDTLADLFSGPADGVAYFDDRARAMALLRDGRAAEAEPVLEALAEQYPRDGENWVRLGMAREQLAKHGEAALAFETAARLLGTGDQITEFHGIAAARNHALAGNQGRALEILRREVFERRSIVRNQLFSWPGLETLQGLAAFREIAGWPDTSGWARVDGWRRDLEHLREEVRRVNPDYRTAPLPVEFDARFDELWRRVPHLSTAELAVGMNRMLATLRQGHVTLWGYPGERHAPVLFYAFPEGMLIVDATDEHRALIGSEVLAIEATPAGDALRRVNEIQSVDGAMQYLFNGPALLRKLSFLVGLGIARSFDSVTITVTRPGETPRDLRLETVPVGRVGFKLAPPPDVAAPLYLRNVAQAHWDHALPAHRAHYVQINNVADDPEETLQAFGVRLHQVLTDSRPENLIIDLRHNNGGNTALYREFLRSVVGFDLRPRSQVYVIIGRGTYSAAGNLVTDLERWVDPVFVGEATSECCRFYGDPSSVLLPYSGISGAVTAVRWNLSWNPFDARREMSPDLPVQLTVEDYRTGRDPSLDAILEVIARRKMDM